jgi:hypothetical protein
MRAAAALAPCLLLSLPLGSVGAAVLGVGPELEVDADAWGPTLHGQWRDDAASTPAGAGDITAADVDANRRRFVPEIDAYLSWQSWELVAGGFAYRTTGSETTPTTASFGTATFPAGTGMHADVRYDDAYGGIALRPFHHARTAVAIGATVHALDGDIEMSSVAPGATGASDSYRKTEPAPALFLRVTTGPWVGVRADATLQWISFDLASAKTKVRLLDAGAAVGWHPLPLIGIRAGYQLYRAYVDIDKSYEKTLDIRLAGPFAGLSILL